MVAAIAAFLLFLGVIGALFGDDGPSQAAPGTRRRRRAESEPTPAVDTKAEKPKPRKATVPRVSGLAGKLAERKLAAAGLVALVVREVPSPRPRGTVLRQLRAVGASIREGSSVGLALAATYPAVPGTAGMTQANAAQRLRGAGFQVRVTRRWSRPGVKESSCGRVPSAPGWHGRTRWSCSSWPTSSVPWWPHRRRRTAPRGTRRA